VAVAAIVGAVVLMLSVLSWVADEPPPRMVPAEADLR